MCWTRETVPWHGRPRWNSGNVHIPSECLTIPLDSAHQPTGGSSPCFLAMSLSSLVRFFYLFISFLLLELFPSFLALRWHDGDRPTAADNRSHNERLPCRCPAPSFLSCPSDNDRSNGSDRRGHKTDQWHERAIKKKEENRWSWWKKKGKLQEDNIISRWGALTYRTSRSVFQ